MENKLKKKYGLLTAIAVVVGTTMGSGIIFRSEEMLRVAGGNLWIGILAWLIGGLIMVSLTYTVTTLATKHENANGIVGISEKLVGKKYSYYLGWFMATVYWPGYTAILAWISARFTVELFGWNVNQFYSAETFVLAGIYLMLIWSANVLSPKLAGKIQLSTTVIKLIPFILLGTIGTIFGLANGITMSNISGAFMSTVSGNPFFAAVVLTAFAFDGWIGAMYVGREIKNSKRNLPLALLIGSLIVVAVNTMYYVGLFSADYLESTTNAAYGTRGAFSNIFGSIGGVALMVFIVLNVLGTTNGLIMGGIRSMHSLAENNQGFKPNTLKTVDGNTNSTTNSGIVFLIISALWLGFYAVDRWYMTNGISFIPITSMIPIAFWVFLVPIFVSMIIKHKDLNWFNRFVAPIAAIAGITFMLGAAIYTHRLGALWYIGIVAGILLIGGVVEFVNKRQSLKKID